MGKFEKGHPQFNTGKTWFKKGNQLRKGSQLSKQSKDKISKSLEKLRLEGKRFNWKGGKRKHIGGYIEIHSSNLPKRSDKNKKYILEHRLVVEKQIGRYLKSEEIVHHIGKRNDNRPNMLIAFVNSSAHGRFHINPNSIKPEEIIFDGRKI